MVMCNKINSMHIGEDLKNVQDCSFHILYGVQLGEVSPKR